MRLYVEITILSVAVITLTVVATFVTFGSLVDPLVQNTLEQLEQSAP